MFRQAVVDHYKDRGYAIRERVKVRGKSGMVHVCDVVAQGRLGNLIISFGDESGFEGPELASLRRAARDIGAGAVVAAPFLSVPVRDAARRNGIMIVDDDLLRRPGPVTMEETTPEVVDHPWPDPDGRPQRASSQAAANGVRPSLWKHPKKAPVREQEPMILQEPTADPSVEPPRESTPPAEEPFAWLHKTGKTAGLARPPASQAAQRPVPEAATTVPAKVRQVEARPRTPPQMTRLPSALAGPAAAKRFEWTSLIAPAVYGVVTAVVLFLFWVLFIG